MRYTQRQLEYIDSVDGKAHQSAIDIIGTLEKAAHMMPKWIVDNNEPFVTECDYCDYNCVDKNRQGLCEECWKKIKTMLIDELNS